MVSVWSRGALKGFVECALRAVDMPFVQVDDGKVGPTTCTAGK